MPITFLQSWGQLTRTRVIYTCLFRENTAVIGKLSDFVSRMQEKEQMLLDYVPWDAAMKPHIPSLLACWVQIRFSNLVDEQWSDRDVVTGVE